MILKKNLYYNLWFRWKRRSHHSDLTTELTGHWVMINTGKSVSFLIKQGPNESAFPHLNKNCALNCFTRAVIPIQMDFSFQNFIRNDHLAKGERTNVGSKGKISLWFTTFIFWSDLQIQLKCLINMEHLKWCQLWGKSFYLKTGLRLTSY